VVDVLDTGKPFGAHRATGRHIRITLDMGYCPVFDGSQYSTAAVAAFTGGVDNFFLAHIIIFLKL
jgi:hypothetical protein